MSTTKVGLERTEIRARKFDDLTAKMKNLELALSRRDALLRRVLDEGLHAELVPLIEAELGDSHE